MHDEHSHDANDDETEDHVHELANWTPDELEDYNPEQTLDTSGNESSLLRHVALCETCVDGKHHKHAKCSCNGLKNGLNFVENKKNADQICVRNSVSAQKNVVSRCLLELFVVTGHSETDSNHNNKRQVEEPNISDGPHFHIGGRVNKRAPGSRESEHDQDKRVSFDNESLSISVTHNARNMIEDGLILILLFLLFDGLSNFVWDICGVHLVVLLLLLTVYRLLVDLTVTWLHHLRLLLHLHLLLLHLNFLLRVLHLYLYLNIIITFFFKITFIIENFKSNK